MEETATTSKKRRWLTVLFVALNIAVIAWTAVREFRGGQGAGHISELTVRWQYLIPAALCMAGSLAAEIAKYMVIMKKTCGFVHPKLCAQTVLLGRYYDNITPSGIGGQPFQIYYMKKNGIPAAQSASTPIAGFLSMQYAFIIIAILCAVFGGHFIGSDAVRIASYIGIVCYSLFPTVILFFTFFPAFSERLTLLITGLLARLRIVKDRDEAEERFVGHVRGYCESLRGLIRHVSLLLAVLGLALVYQAALMCVPFFVVRAFGGDVPFVQCFVTTVTIYAAITFIPTPGNAGAAEGVFYAVFSSLSGGHVFWAMLVWRFIIYYVYIVYGILHYLVTHIRRKLCGDRRPAEDRGGADVPAAAPEDGLSADREGETS
ncbi:MAG: flippase-like domain-containing protein [Lachnospiraceae bacterium]|nr:flippase-like domain-containing protein [Lachnospiraceae bacterium]